MEQLCPSNTVEILLIHLTRGERRVPSNLDSGSEDAQYLKHGADDCSYPSPSVSLAISWNVQSSTEPLFKRREVICFSGVIGRG